LKSSLVAAAGEEAEEVADAAVGAAAVCVRAVGSRPRAECLAVLAWEHVRRRGPIPAARGQGADQWQAQDRVAAARGRVDRCPARDQVAAQAQERGPAVPEAELRKAVPGLVVLVLVVVLVKAALDRAGCRAQLLVRDLV
jgi:hypothetical protein